jgi:hypothetical protein
MKIKRVLLVARLDNLFSHYIRLRDKRAFGRCPFCSGPIQCCFHFVTRSKHSVRWENRNAVGSCHGCNFKNEHDPHFAISWYIESYGLENYNQLVKDGNIIAKFSMDDLRGIKERIECDIAGALIATKTFGRKA